MISSCWPTRRRASARASTGKKVGTLASYTATSFYPSKPLGGYGDGGAIFTDDDDKAKLLLALRCHGKEPDRSESEFVGLNSRLDTIQAAILLEKLRLFPQEIAARQAGADRYAEGLGAVVQVPSLMTGRHRSGRNTPSWSSAATNSPRRAARPACRPRSTIPARIHALPSYREFPKAPGLRQTEAWRAA